MNVEIRNIEELIPYINNPRNNENAIEPVVNSIKEFGFRIPIVIDKDNVVIAGHTRLIAAEKLGIKEIPCLVASDLTPEQVKAFRLVDNKTSEFADWDFELLEEELSIFKEINMENFGFESFDYSFIDDLEKENLGEYENSESEFFSMTFLFPIEIKEKLENYIKKYGKESILTFIIEKIT